ncbi:AAA family ATPase [Streptomyces sp. NPDC006906]|uniref:AAA family ATPase n=1 Tax=Streptomyces sp. NPDC006906 TaxID=3154782 RepID=UPI0033C9FF5D
MDAGRAGDRGHCDLLAVRGELVEDLEDPRPAALGVRRSRALRQARSRARTIIDSTNLRASTRAGLLARAARWERPAVAVLFDVLLATVEAQNAGRDRVVPAHVVREFHRLLPTADQLDDEGWPTVHVASALTRRTR